MARPTNKRDSTTAATRLVRISTTLASLFAVLGVAMAGCEKPASKHPAREQVAGTARLPPPPDLNPTSPPKTYPDGVWSVAGLFRDGAESSGKVITVRGHIAKIQRCSDDKTPCPRPPHMQLTDGASLHGRRLLVGGPIEQNPHWKTGQRIDVRGTFVRSSADGRYLAPRGLLVLAPAAEDNPAGSGR